MWENYSPIEDKIFRLIDDEGKLIFSDHKIKMSEKKALEAYKHMLFARTADKMAVSYQRQGRMYTYPENFGQEAIATAAGMVFRKEDWLVIAFREMSAWLLKGGKLRDIFMYFGGYEDGSLFSGAPNILPSSVPIASQLLHAVGIGYAIKLRKEKKVVFAFVGDGGTSQGDFHEALNFAAVWKVPIVFIIQNNQFAISVPVSKQTASVNLAIKSTAYGLPGIKVDGNDVFAMYETINEAAEYALAGNGPSLIEALTYRRGAHTTSDDPSLYRTEKEEKFWKEKDPVKRLKNYLIDKKLITDKYEEELIEKFKEEVEEEFAYYENHPPYKLEDVFKYNYKEIPDDLKKQQSEYLDFLNWKEKLDEGNESSTGNK